MASRLARSDAVRTVCRDEGDSMPMTAARTRFGVALVVASIGLLTGHAWAAPGDQTTTTGPATTGPATTEPTTTEPTTTEPSTTEPSTTEPTTTNGGLDEEPGSSQRPVLPSPMTVPEEPPVLATGEPPVVPQLASSGVGGDAGTGRLPATGSETPLPFVAVTATVVGAMIVRLSRRDRPIVAPSRSSRDHPTERSTTKKHDS